VENKKRVIALGFFDGVHLGHAALLKLCRQRAEELETIPGITPNPADLGPGCEFADRCPYCEARCREKDIPRFELSPGHYVRCLRYDSYQEVE